MFVKSVIAAAIFAAGATAAHAADKTFGSWQVTCKDGPCQAYLGLKDQKTGKLALSASAHKRADSAHPTLVLTLPLGVDVRAGAALVPGASAQKPIPAAIDVCYPDGCRAVIELSPATVDALNAAKSFDVRFAAYGVSDRVESITIPANGLKEAVASLAAKN